MLAPPPAIVLCSSPFVLSSSSFALAPLFMLASCVWGGVGGAGGFGGVRGVGVVLGMASGEHREDDALE